MVQHTTMLDGSLSEEVHTYIHVCTYVHTHNIQVTINVHMHTHTYACILTSPAHTYVNIIAV